jgi:hypothetical protein
MKMILPRNPKKTRVETSTSGFLYTTGMDEGTKKTPIPKCRLYWCFCLEWCINFVGSESGQKQRVKLLQNMVYNTTQINTPPPTATHCLYILYVYFEKEGRGGGGQREGRGATVRKYQHD